MSPWLMPLSSDRHRTMSFPLAGSSQDLLTGNLASSNVPCLSQRPLPSLFLAVLLFLCNYLCSLRAASLKCYVLSAPISTSSMLAIKKKIDPSVIFGGGVVANEKEENRTEERNRRGKNIYMEGKTRIETRIESHARGVRRGYRIVVNTPASVLSEALPAPFCNVATPHKPFIFPPCSPTAITSSTPFALYL